MRASHAPREWSMVLTALQHDDYDTAHKLVVKYGFTGEKGMVTNANIKVRREPRAGDFVAKAPGGKLSCHEASDQLSLFLGFSGSYVENRVRKFSHKVITKGKMKGWSFWRN